MRAVPKNVCLGSAHDNIPTYELLERWDINALVDINGRAKPSPDAPKASLLTKQGMPIGICIHLDARYKAAHLYAA